MANCELCNVYSKQCEIKEIVNEQVDGYDSF